jgi:hypothetical protein
MHVEAILQTHPRPLVADAGALAHCIDELATCAATCTICADACLGEADGRELTRCARRCLDCADACIAAGRIASRQTHAEGSAQVAALEACVTACRASAEECERHAQHHEHCRLCAQECRRCERECDDMAAVLRS